MLVLLYSGLCCSDNIFLLLPYTRNGELHFGITLHI